MAITNATRLADFGTGIGTAGAVLQIDNSAKEIGIGTTNPNATLTVGNIGASGTSIYVHGDGRIIGVLTATSFSGDGSGLTNLGVSTAAVPGISTQLHSVFGTINVSGVSTYGGNVDINANLDVSGTSTLNDDVTFTGSAYNATWDKTDNTLEFVDGARATFGTGNDLIITHASNQSRIDETSGAGLEIGSIQVTITPNGGGEKMAEFNADGAAELYYDNSKKFETTGAGVIVTGVCTATSFAGDGSALTGTVNTGKAIAMAMMFG